MRTGIRIGESVVWAIVLAASGFCSIGSASAADKVQSVPLGGSATVQPAEQTYGVFVPTRFGGSLTIMASEGAIEGLTGPDGRARKNGEEVGENQHGWYTFKVTGVPAGKSITLETTFIQVAQAAKVPWNFYYWPTKGDAIHEPWAGGNGRVDTPRPYGDDVMVASYGSYIAPGHDIILPGPNGLLETPVSPGDDSTWFPNLYDDLTFRGADGTTYMTPSPLLKFDQIFGTSARNYEAANTQNRDIQRWPGHCLGGAIASITFNEPIPAPGTGMTADELKGLYAELGENHYNHQIGENLNNMPAGPPRPGFDPTDAFVPRLHAMLEGYIRGRKKALLANLRAFPPNGTPSEVWNHGVGKYVAKYHALPGRGERAVRIELELVGNSGSNLNNSDNKPRVNLYEYVLVYGLNGQVDETQQAASDFISVGGEALYAPLNVMDVVNSRWQGHNSYITLDRVQSMDMANGGGNRFANRQPPQFRPVGSYEAGRPTIFANREGGVFGGGSDLNGNAPPRRGGLFRGLFGR